MTLRNPKHKMIEKNKFKLKGKGVTVLMELWYPALSSDTCRMGRELQRLVSVVLWAFIIGWDKFIRLSLSIFGLMMFEVFSPWGKHFVINCPSPFPCQVPLKNCFHGPVEHTSWAPPGGHLFKWILPAQRSWCPFLA